MLLTDRFPFLSFVPADVRTNYLLDGAAVRVAVVLKRSGNQLNIGMLPNDHFADVMERLRVGGRFPPVEPDTTYEVIVDERGRAEMRVGGNVVASNRFAERVLELLHETLEKQAQGYAKDLDLLLHCEPEAVRHCTRENLNHYFERCQRFGMLAVAAQNLPRVRVFCLGCLQQTLGRVMPLLVHDISDESSVCQMPLGRDPRTFEAIGQLIGEQVTGRTFLLPLPERCEALAFPSTYAHLYQTGFQAVVESDFQSAFTEFVSLRASTPAES